MKKATRSVSTPANHHAVRFYESDRSLAVIVADFLSDGLGDGSPAVVVATPARRAAILRELGARSCDVVELQRSGQLVLLDAEATLSTFMIEGTPDAARFRKNICEVMNRACEGQQDCTLRIYGEMVDVLWEAGQHDAAIKLEMLWNQLASTEAFSLLCGYAMGHFYKEVDVDRVCSQHTHVVSSRGERVEVARDDGRSQWLEGGAGHEGLRVTFALAAPDLQERSCRPNCSSREFSVSTAKCQT